MSKPRGAVIVFMSGKQTVLHGVRVSSQPIELIEKFAGVLVHGDAISSLNNFRRELRHAAITERLVLVSNEFADFGSKQHIELTAECDTEEVVQVSVDSGTVAIDGIPIATLELRESKRCRTRNECHDAAGEHRQGSHLGRRRSPDGHPKFELLGTRAPVKFVW